MGCVPASVEVGCARRCRRLVKAYYKVMLAGRWGRRIGARSLCCFENNSAMLFGKTLRDAAQYTHRLSQSEVNGGLIPSFGDFTQCWWITGIPSAARVDSTNPH